MKNTVSSKNLFLSKNNNDEFYNILAEKKEYLKVKRIFDFLLSSALIIILAPLFIVIAILIKLDSRGPIIYRQKRITQYGKEFDILKFRTMLVGADKKGPLVTTEKDDRITRIGKILRNIRLDELPQLFNIIKGEMSFVGARPEVPFYVNKYDSKYNLTLLFPAGVTSIASIKFMDENAIIEAKLRQGMDIDNIYLKFILPKKMYWNLKYIYEASVLNDLKICFMTVWSVFRKR